MPTYFETELALNAARIHQLEKRNAELLEACKYTLENLQHYQTHNQIFITAMEGIKQAIAKAEGGK